MERRSRSVLETRVQRIIWLEIINGIHNESLYGTGTITFAIFVPTGKRYEMTYGWDVHASERIFGAQRKNLRHFREACMQGEIGISVLSKWQGKNL